MRKLDYEVPGKSLAISSHCLVEHSRFNSVQLCELGIHHHALATCYKYLARNFGR